MFAALRTFNLIVAGLAVTAPMAHVLELPNKLTLDGPLWLAIQQILYRGWGAIFGPLEIIALLSAAVLVVLRKQRGLPIATTIVATLAYAAMLVVFFVFNNPVNAALSTWTPETLPADWPDYRLRWEAGHAASAVLSVIAFVCLIRAWIGDRYPSRVSGPI